MTSLQVYNRKSVSRLCLLILFIWNLINTAEGNDPSQGICVTRQDSSCISPAADNGERHDMLSSHLYPEVATDGEDRVEPDSLLYRSMQGLEIILDKMASSSDQMMHDMIEKMSDSRAKMMAGLESMMDKMSESRTKVMKGLDSMMEKVAKTKKQMVDGFDNVMDQVSHSKMIEEFDLVLESIKKSKLLVELRALPEEIRQSFILSARNQSYMLAGILVALTSAILFGGAIYYAWCHHDAWSYYIGTIDEAKSLLKQYNESGLLSPSRTSSNDSVLNKRFVDRYISNDNKEYDDKYSENLKENNFDELKLLNNDFDDENDETVFEDYSYSNAYNQNGNAAQR